MDAREAASGSLGCQVTAGNAAAKWTACCPVPLAISRTTPALGQDTAQHIEDGSAITFSGGCDAAQSVGVIGLLGLTVHFQMKCWRA